MKNTKKPTVEIRTSEGAICEWCEFCNADFPEGEKYLAFIASDGHSVDDCCVSCARTVAAKLKSAINDIEKENH